MHHDSELCSLLITCLRNTLIYTIFCIVFASVKYKLNTDQSMQLTLTKTRRIYRDVYLILTKNHLTSKACDTINCEPDRAHQCLLCVASCFLSGCSVSSNTAFRQARPHNAPQANVSLHHTNDRVRIWLVSHPWWISRIISTYLFH